ncbi:MAG: hypothetical protein C4523_20005 [Myxococcales bacterium]|nr:MAG: hypothetical protein C4523_20005 [Myxococcales bacterium]
MAHDCLKSGPRSTQLDKWFLVANCLLLACLAFVAGGGCRETDASSIYFDSESLYHCDDVTDLFPVAPLLEQPDHPCYEWVSSTYGRAVKWNHSGSASVWTRDTERGTAIVASAVHVVKDLDKYDAESEAGLFNPETETGSLSVRLPEPDGRSTTDLVSVSFPLFLPPIPPERMRGNPMHLLPPTYDFALFAMDGQLAPKGGVTGFLAGEPKSIQPTSPRLNDPAELTTMPPTWADVAPGDLVLTIGYPKTAFREGELAASVGRVLSDEEIAIALKGCADAGDEEGMIPYDPKAEFILEGYSALGMSGGGVYDRAGRQAGILVRMSIKEGAPPIIRVVRMRRVIRSLKAVYNSLSPEEQKVVKPYLEKSIIDGAT